MRQQSQSQQQSNTGISIESSESRKERIDKKRAIRKSKVAMNNDEQSQIKKQIKNLTKEQKAQIQKAKNRQAAQRSRDQHKKYVETLEEQNRLLREKLSRQRLCLRCAKEIQSESGDSTDPNLSDFSQDRHLPTFVQNQNNQEYQQFQSPFIRMNDYEESSPLKMFLLISMIMMGIFLMSGGIQATPADSNVIIKRDLMEIQYSNNQNIKQNDSYPRQNKKSKQILDINRFQLRNQIENSFNMVENSIQDKIMTEVMPLSYQLSPLSQQNCIKSIIDNNFDQKKKAPFQQKEKVPFGNTNFLRSDSLNQIEVFSHANKEAGNNILFCSLPKLYRKNEEMGPNFFSKFIDIILSGSQMMEIIGKSPNVWMNKMINFNGIYKINAEVKEIVQIEDRNCIL